MIFVIIIIFFIFIVGPVYKKERENKRDFCRSLNSLLIRAEIFNAILLSLLSLVRKFDSIGPVYNYILFFSSLLHQSHLMIINSVRRWWQRHSLGLPELPLLSSSSIDKERERKNKEEMKNIEKKRRRTNGWNGIRSVKQNLEFRIESNLNK